MLFGSDWPFAPEIAVSWSTGSLDGHAPIDDATRAAVDRDSAAALLPPLAATHV